MSAPAVHGPAQLPDLRLWLADQWAEGRPFHRAAAPYHAVRAAAMLGRAAGPRLVEGYAAHERLTLQHATLWWVAEPMVDLLLAAAAGVPDDVHVADLPKMPTCGLVVFAKPWLGIDGTKPDHQVTVDALAWGVVRVPNRSEAGLRMALALSVYQCLDFGAGLGSDELQMAASTGAIAHADHRPLPHTPEAEDVAHRLVERSDAMQRDDVSMAAVGAQPDHPEWGTFNVSPVKDGRHVTSLVGSTWMPLGRSDWPVDDALGTAPWDEEPELTTASMMEDRRVVAALWTLLHQEGIAQQVVHRPERQAVRRTQRAGVPAQLAEVRVVTLRQLHRTESEPSDGDHPAREWSHRWLVGGHWRYQACGKGRAERRLTYIAPYIKGPDDKPLRVPTRVNAWVR